MPSLKINGRSVRDAGIARAVEAAYRSTQEARAVRLTEFGF